jgi:TM2 domain-containing membrane protein YozV
MPQDDAVYDLGEVDLNERKTAAFPAIFGEKRGGAVRRERVRSDPRAARVGPQLAGSLSLFVPGLGHLLAGEATWGLFYAASLGFCASAIWAAFSMKDWLVSTLRVLGVQVELVVIAVAGLVVTAMLLHLAAISHAQSIAGGADAADGAHPIVAGLASLVLPGWGQILAGHPKRATLFVGALWVIGGAWLAATPLGLRGLHALGFEIPPALREDWGTAILIAAPAVLWVISIYDAARR